MLVRRWAHLRSQLPPLPQRRINLKADWKNVRAASAASSSPRSVAAKTCRTCRFPWLRSAQSSSKSSTSTRSKITSNRSQPSPQVVTVPVRARSISAVLPRPRRTSRSPVSLALHPTLRSISTISRFRSPAVTLTSTPPTLNGSRCFQARKERFSERVRRRVLCV